MNSLPWFRLYIDLLNDPQVQTLSDAHFRAYINTLCIASAQNPRGELPPLKDYAFALHRTEQQASKTLASLLAAGLLEGCLEGGKEVVRVKKWALHQFDSDTSSQRVQLHRSNMKRFRNVSETAPERDTDSDSDSDSDSESTISKKERDPDPINIAREETASVSLSASQDHSFKLTEERWQKAQSIGVPSKAWVEKETAKFDLEHGDKLHTYKDPDKAWLKWLHRGKEYAEQHPNVVPMTPQRRSKMFFAEG